jgi:outer membrane protein OmpA-like peptidoglycan-associated protein
MASKVRVYGKSYKWTALGILDAYTKMYPHATLEDFNKAFPRKEFTDKRPDENLWEKIEVIEERAKATTSQHDDEIIADSIAQGYFITLSNGDKVTFFSNGMMWTKDNFPKLEARAKLYDIEIAEFEKAEKGFGKKGQYALEYLNGYVPPVPTKKGMPKWLLALIAVLGLAVVALLLWLLLGKKAEPQVVEVEKIVVVHDTLYIQQIAEIEKNFNAAEFELGKAELSEDAKFVLHDLAKVMKDNEGLTLKILGHTSAEGDAQLNQKLSEARAKAAVDFLVEREGVAAERLSYEGLGSSQLKNTENPNAPENRRTEFVVVE